MNRSRIYMAALIVAGVFFIALPGLYADVVLMNDGNKMMGDVKEENGEYEVVTASGSFWVKKSEVKHIYKDPAELTAQADELQKAVRAMVEESKKMEDAEAANLKLREAIDTFQKKVLSVYVDARDLFDTDHYNYLDERIQKIAMELRIYRGNYKSVAKKAEPQKADPDPTKGPAPEPPVADKKDDPPAEPTAKNDPADSGEPDPSFEQGFEKYALDQLMIDFLKKGGKLEDAVKKYDSWRKEGGDVTPVRPILAAAFFEHASQLWEKSKRSSPSSQHRKILADLRQAIHYESDKDEVKALMMEVLLYLTKGADPNTTTLLLTEAIIQGLDIAGDESDPVDYPLMLGRAYYLRGEAARKKYNTSRTEIKQIMEDYKEAKDWLTQARDDDDATDKQKDEADALIKEIDKLLKAGDGGDIKKGDTKAKGVPNLPSKGKGGGGKGGGGKKR